MIIIALFHESLLCPGSWPSFLCTYILLNFTEEEKGAQRSSVTGRAVFLCSAKAPLPNHSDLLPIAALQSLQ